MLNVAIIIILYSLFINWIVSLALLSFFSQDKKVRIRSAILSTISGCILGYLVYLL
jgi:hypothetical protein